MACPICTKPLSSENRLITEDCGHAKCRQCLISEANGCEKCKQNQTSAAIDAKQTSMINVSNENSLVEQKGTKSRKAAIPTHIVKTTQDDGEVTYHCTICDKHFKSRTQQYYHLFCNNTSNKPFKCDVCIKFFSTSAHLKYHRAGHTTQSFRCSVCNKSFSKIQILKKHEKLHESVAEQCSECGAKLRNKEALEAHVKRHQNILPFECDKCDKKFSLSTSLRMHQQIIHIATKKFKCDICGKVFNRNSSLRTHSKSHSHQKLLGCSKCSRLFISKKSLLRHSRIHDVKSRFKCSFCDTSSIRKDNILRHIRNTHPNENKSCIEEIAQDHEASENESSGSEISQTQPQEDDNFVCDVPKIIPNSSVIRCIGNVKPVTIVNEDQVAAKRVVEETKAVTNHKKLKKPYDPHEIYRKILYDEDSTQDDNDIGNKSEELPANNKANDGDGNNKNQELSVQESIVNYNGQSSNFSETHWRKNFKHNYQIQFD